MSGEEAVQVGMLPLGVTTGCFVAFDTALLQLGFCRSQQPCLRQGRQLCSGGAQRCGSGHMGKQGG